MRYGNHGAFFKLCAQHFLYYPISLEVYISSRLIQHN